MKAILNHIDKENTITNTSKIAHPSYQTEQKPYKSTIKVGYKPKPQDDQEKRHKKAIIITKPLKTERCGVKQIENKQKISGKFVQSYYTSNANENNQAKFHKKGVEQAYQKYRAGKQFSQQLQNQFMPKSRSSRSINTGRERVITERERLSGYKNEGIKDIVEYKHAGSFREEKVSSKCNEALPAKRCFQFQQINQFDFRKHKFRLY